MTSPKRWHFSKRVQHLQPAFFSTSPFLLPLVDDNAIVAGQSLIFCMHCPAFEFSLAGQSQVLCIYVSSCSPVVHRCTVWQKMRTGLHSSLSCCIVERSARGIINIVNRFWACAQQRFHNTYDTISKKSTRKKFFCKQLFLSQSVVLSQLFLSQSVSTLFLHSERRVLQKECCESLFVFTYKMRLHLVLLLIGWKIGPRVLSQSLNVAISIA